MKLIEIDEYPEVDLDLEPMALGKIYSRRAVWETGEADRPYFMATVVAYTEGHYLDRDGNNLEQVDPGDSFEWMQCIDALDFDREDFTGLDMLAQFYEMQSTELMHFTDLDDPSMSEVDRDYEYEDIGEIWQQSLGDSNELCRNHIASFNFERAFNGDEYFARLEFERLQPTLPGLDKDRQIV